MGHRGTEVGESVKPVVTKCWTNGHISDEDVNNFKAAYAIDFQKYGYSSDVPTVGYDQAPQVGMAEKENVVHDLPLPQEEVNRPLENSSRSTTGRPNSLAAIKPKSPNKLFPPKPPEPAKRNTARAKPFESPISPRT